VLLDLMLPDMSGYELCRILQQKDYLKNIPIIFQTGLVDHGEEIKSLKQAGSIGLLHKPYNKEDLFKMIDKLGNVNKAL